MRKLLQVVNKHISNNFYVVMFILLCAITIFSAHAQKQKVTMLQQAYDESYKSHIELSKSYAKVLELARVQIQYIETLQKELAE